MIENVRAWGNIVSACRAYKHLGKQLETRNGQGEGYVLEYRNDTSRYIASFDVIGDDAVVIDTITGKREDELRNVMFSKQCARHIYRQLIDAGFKRVR